MQPLPWMNFRKCSWVMVFGIQFSCLKFTLCFIKLLLINFWTNLTHFQEIKFCLWKFIPNIVQLWVHYVAGISRSINCHNLLSFLASALDGSEWSASYLSCFTHWRNSPDYPLYRGQADPTASSDILEKRKISFPCQESNRNSSVIHRINYTLYCMLSQLQNIPTAVIITILGLVLILFWIHNWPGIPQR